MKVRALLILILFAAVPAFSQKYEEFGTISMKDLTSEPYVGDTASAIVLFDVGKLEVEPNNVAGTTLKRHLRVKILKKEALFEWGSRKILIPKSGDLKPKGITYNLENGVIKKSELELSSVMRTNHNSDYELITIALPNVREGSVFDLYYVLRLPDFYFLPWEFQHSVPSRMSEFTANLAVKDVKYSLGGLLKPDVHEEKYEGQFHHWKFLNIPAFVREPLMADRDGYISKVGFASRYYDWGSIVYDLVKDEKKCQHFGAIVHRYRFLTSTVEEITTGIVDEKQKIKVITNYVKDLVKHNGRDDFFGVNPNEAIDKKEGSTGDINLLLGSMLEKAGFNVSMVLLSTRGHGVVDQKLPSLHQFNYVICEVVTKEGHVLVDATDKLLAFDMLPPRCYTNVGFLIGTEQYGWAPIVPRQRSKVLLDATVTFTEAGGLAGKLKSYKDGYAAYEVRSKLRQGGRDNYKFDLGNKLWNIQNYEIKNTETADKPLEEVCDVSIDDYVIQANDKIYLNPHLFLREVENPFKSDSRTYPVDFGELIDNTVVCNLIIPEGYVVDELPANKVLALPGNAGKCAFSTSVDGDKIQVMSKLIFNKTFFQPIEYAALKEFYGALVAKKAENIVLKKK